ncbi:nucleolar protein 12-domain-containing protein [Crassisporium funariophilum]|nr:nucleolar protein 12-domain-containing protein [Crassisporium funariophilum]
MSPNNFTVLTQSHKAIAAKKKAKREQIKEITFDDEARREFLTGFHKRKLAKAEAARSKAKEREKQDRLEARREQRRMLREQAIENSTQVEKAYGAVIAHSCSADEDADDWTGIGSSQKQDNGRDEEFEDEEMLATVTVIEDFDPDTIIHGPANPNPPTIPSQPLPSTTPFKQPTSILKSRHDSAPKTKVRAKKVRYESIDERKRERTKQHARRTEKAELAGGKAARNHKSSRGPKRKGGSKR